MTMAIPDWSRAPVLVVGDLILDRFVQGTVRRISPEAPIPVVEVTGERRIVGGAANVANNILALGGKATLLGAVGEDRHGDSLRALLAQLGLDPEGALRVPGRITTVKTRIIAQHQQVVRVDRETREPLDEESWESLKIRIREHLSSHRALVVSDYAKGIFTAARLKMLGRLAQETGIPYVVDPKPAHFPYPGATVVTPNRQEAAAIYGRTFATQELARVAADLLGRTDWEAILFTLGEEGMALANRDGSVERIIARVREVFDVTGAGDTVVAALALGLASGIPLLDAARLANAAAGVVVGKPGTAVCSAQELAEALRCSS